MQIFQCSEIVLAVRKLLTELETEYPALAPHELEAVMIDGISSIKTAIECGRAPESAKDFAIAEAHRLKQIPPW